MVACPTLHLREAVCVMSAVYFYVHVRFEVWQRAQFISDPNDLCTFYAPHSMLSHPIARYTLSSCVTHSYA